MHRESYMVFRRLYDVPTRGVCVLQAKWEALLPQLECVSVPDVDGVQGSAFATFGALPA